MPSRRVTNDQLQTRVDRINRMGFRFQLEWQYGHPRLVNENQSRNISPRLQKKAMLDYLDAFIDALKEVEYVKQ